MENDLKVVEGEIVPIYETSRGERVINARELFYKLRGDNTKTKFSDWIKERLFKYKFVENVDYIKRKGFSLNYEKPLGGRPTSEYYLTFDTSKELCMIENNEIGRIIRKYFIEIEKRLKNAEYKIEQNTKSIGDFKRLSDGNEKKIDENSHQIERIKRKIDVIIQKDYCLASDIAEQIGVYSENNLPHSNFIGAIARYLGMKISYKHYYEDENIAIVPDISKGNEYYQVYYKKKAVKEIINWFNKNKEEIEYKIIYERNTKNGAKGEVKEKGYRIENVCYKIKL